MKTKLSLLLCLLLMAMTLAAQAEGIEIDGAIKAGRTLTITAPYTGTVGDFTAAAGNMCTAGDALFPLSVTTVYAETDGTVTGLFAQAGDQAATVIDRFGALGYVEAAAEIWEQISSNAESAAIRNVCIPGGNGGLAAGFIYGIHAKLPFLCVALSYGLGILVSLLFLLHQGKKSKC